MCARQPRVTKYQTCLLPSTCLHAGMSTQMKEKKVPAMEHFMAERVLGEGGFGQVLEVVKRDCGKHYAMKVMRMLFHDLLWPCQD